MERHGAGRHVAGPGRPAQLPVDVEDLLPARGNRGRRQLAGIDTGALSRNEVIAQRGAVSTTPAKPDAVADVLRQSPPVLCKKFAESSRNAMAWRRIHAAEV